MAIRAGVEVLAVHPEALRARMFEPDKDWVTPLFEILDTKIARLLDELNSSDESSNTININANRVQEAISTWIKENDSAARALVAAYPLERYFPILLADYPAIVQTVIGILKTFN